MDILHVTFVKNSDEDDQRYFATNLTHFTAEGIELQLNFSDPLLISAGENADFIRIKMLKSYFM